MLPNTAWIDLVMYDNSRWRIKILPSQPISNFNIIYYL